MTADDTARLVEWCQHCAAMNFHGKADLYRAIAQRLREAQEMEDRPIEVVVPKEHDMTAIALQWRVRAEAAEAKVQALEAREQAIREALSRDYEMPFTRLVRIRNILEGR